MLRTPVPAAPLRGPNDARQRTANFERAVWCWRRCHVRQSGGSSFACTITKKPGFEKQGAGRVTQTAQPGNDTWATCAACTTNYTGYSHETASIRQLHKGSTHVVGWVAVVAGMAKSDDVAGAPKVRAGVVVVAAVLVPKLNPWCRTKTGEPSLSWRPLRQGRRRRILALSSLPLLWPQVFLQRQTRAQRLPLPQGHQT